MADVIREMAGHNVEDFPSSEEIRMLVISNQSKVYGAAHILDNDILKKCAEIENADLVILPSSVYECILVPVSKNTNIRDMTNMVKEINATQLQAEEVLSDHPYIYSRERNRIEIAA